MLSSQFVLFGIFVSVHPMLLWGFVSTFRLNPSQYELVLPAEKKDGGPGGYKFGDITKSMINRVTGKEEYQFGDLSRFLDQRAKSAVNELTGKDEYEFGDLSRFADARVKERLNSFTGKEEYQLGDVSKEILNRVASGDYKLEDIIFLCRVLASFGVGLAPVASALPVKLLLDMLNASILKDVGGRLLEALAVSVDQRFKEAITGDAEYKMGDYTKRAILSFVGKDGAEQYEFGDVTKAIAKRMKEGGNKGTRAETFGVTESQKGKKDSPLLDENLVAELERWDSLRKSYSEKEK